ncbi:hypothetical protein [Cellulomonas hominis]|nr:hypothetical protein [Cellulomonas hominis]
MSTIDWEATSPVRTWQTSGIATMRALAPTPHRKASSESAFKVGRMP